MALVIETGAGLANADSFVSVDDFKAICDARGYVYGTDDTAIEQALRRATDHISGNFAWKGFKVNTRNDDVEQALEWPRYYVIDRDGYTVPSDTIPKEIIRATALVAVREIAQPFAFEGLFQGNEIVTSERVDVIAVTYDASGVSARDTIPVLTRVMDEIGQFLGGGAQSSGGAIFGQTART